MEKDKKLEASDNIIIADADYVDSVAFNLIVNFERMIGRHIPQADMAQWVECIAIDGGLNAPVDPATTTHVVLVHDKNVSEMNNFNPGIFEAEDATDGKTTLNGQAFKGDMGEFSFSCVASDDKKETFTKNDIICDIVAAMVDEPKARRVMIVPNLDPGKDDIMNSLLPILRHLDRQCQDKRITLFAMQPISGVPCRTEILGYSLMAALGIKADEIKA